MRGASKNERVWTDCDKANVSSVAENGKAGRASNVNWEKSLGASVEPRWSRSFKYWPAQG